MCTVVQRLRDSGVHDAADLIEALLNRDNRMLVVGCDMRRALDKFICERENLEDRAPVDPECGVCNLGTGPHKRTCAYHAAVAVLKKAEGVFL